MRNRRILKSKKIILGLTGSIAIYRSVELARSLIKAGAEVNVIFTDAAKRFITPLLMESITGRASYSDTFQYPTVTSPPMAHIELAQSADLLVIAPATANIIGKLASGIADDLLSTLFLAIATNKVLIAPAMNWRMYENPFVQDNIKRLKEMGVNIIGPTSGPLCCGEEGYGRMAEIEDIIDEIEYLLSEKDMKGLKVLVTAGPTREYLDPVRFLSNRSSGKMGYAIARLARQRGADVTLVSGPSSLRVPFGVRILKVETTEEMLEAVLSLIKDVDMLFMAAAPADFRFRKAEEKIRRDQPLSLELLPTPDIILSLRHQMRSLPDSKKRPFIVGFAAETSDNIERAKEKLFTKGLDMIVLNNVLEPGAGFEVDTNKVFIITPEGGETTSPPTVTSPPTAVEQTGLLSKEEIAEIIIERALLRYRLREES